MEISFSTPTIAIRRLRRLRRFGHNLTNRQSVSTSQQLFPT